MWISEREREEQEYRASAIRRLVQQELTDKPCDRDGCKSTAAFWRPVADPNSRGLNLNEPGMRLERICEAHAEEIRQYVGSRLWTLVGSGTVESEGSP